LIQKCLSVVKSLFPLQHKQTTTTRKHTLVKRLTSCLSPSAVVLPLINYLRLTGEINKGDDGEDDSDRGLNNMVEKEQQHHTTTTTAPT